MDFASPAASWAYQRASAAGLERASPDWSGAAEFRRLVEAATAHPAAGRWYATRSHLALVVSPAAKHRDRVHRPRVVIEPLESAVRVHRITAGGSAGVAEEAYPAGGAAVAAALSWLAAADAEPGSVLSRGDS